MATPTSPKIVPITAQSLGMLQAFDAEPLAVRQNIASLFQGRRYTKGAALITQKDPDYGVFFVLSGSARVTYLSKRGREVSFRDIAAGEMFGELSTLDDGVRSAQVIATNNITVAWLARERFVALAYSQPRFADYVMRYLAHLVRLLTERVVEMTTLGVVNRIHAELLRLARTNGAPTRNASATIDFNRDEIARRISTHREAVSREITVMEKAGLVKRVGRSSLLVTDVKRLEAMVEEVSG